LPLQDEGVGSVHGGNPSVCCALMASIVWKMEFLTNTGFLMNYAAGYPGFAWY
jgi:uncharacterized transporter YbjL